MAIVLDRLSEVPATLRQSENGARMLAAHLNQRSVAATPVGSLLGNVAGVLGRGLVAGLIGTLAITAVAAADQEIRRRVKRPPSERKPPETLFKALIGPWLYSADALGKVLGGVTPADEVAKRRLALAAHTSYGTSWGMSLGILDLAGLRGPAAMGLLLGGILGAEMGVMPRLGFFPPVGLWGREAVISSSYQHAVYAIAAGLTYDLLKP
ncbi:hypothetical protein D3C86_352620 [compost metagenome]